MIAKIVIENGKFVRGFARPEQSQLKISDSKVEWSGKWRATLEPDAIKCSSFYGGNIVEFDVRLNGMSRLSLNKMRGEKQTIRIKRVFQKQRNLDGELYLIFNIEKNFRSAYFESKEYLDLLQKNDLINCIHKDPNAIRFKDKMTDQAVGLTKYKGLSVYSCKKRSLITDGKINIEDVSKSSKEHIGLVSVQNATWAIIEKFDKRSINRVLITRKTLFDILRDNNLPKAIKTRSKCCSAVGVPENLDGLRYSG